MPGMPDQTQQILHDLTKASIDIYLHAKKCTFFLPQIVSEILKFKNSCSLVGGEHFGL